MNKKILLLSSLLILLPLVANAVEYQTDQTDEKTKCIQINRGGTVTYACFPKEEK